MLCLLSLSCLAAKSHAVRCNVMRRITLQCSVAAHTLHSSAQLTLTNWNRDLKSLELSELSIHRQSHKLHCANAADQNHFEAATQDRAGRATVTSNQHVFTVVGSMYVSSAEQHAAMCLRQVMRQVMKQSLDRPAGQ